MGNLAGNGISGSAPIVPGSSAAAFSAPGQTQGGVDLSQYGPAINQALQSLGIANAGQAGLVGQLQKTINGTGGPNTAQQELVNATQANNQTGAGQIASQQGISPGLGARRIENETMNNNQEAAGQAAQLRLEQQQAAQQEEAGVLGQQGNEANSALATTTGAQAAQDTNQTANQGLNQSAQVAQLNAQTQLAGATLGAAGTALAGAKLAEGGEVDQPSADPRDVFMKMYAQAPSKSHANQLIEAYKAGKAHAAVDMTHGGEIEGKDAEYPGDDERNDTNLIEATKGEVMIPRTLVKESKHNPEAVIEFLRMVNRGESGHKALISAKHMTEAR